MSTPSQTPPQEPPRSRYPGARPFSDSANDQARFFGRDREAEELFLRVLSVPLLVQFGRSGLGKTSLLQAGLFPRLRERAYLPLMIRLNAPMDSLFDATKRAIQESCEAEALDFTPGDPAGLWEFLATSVLWRGDLLLTPVLVLDQFEEVFTLRDARFRSELAAELGALATGVPPPRPMQTAAKPLVKIVISLREDYLGALEEFSAAIPGLFHERLRLEPFTADAAREAITGPAGLTAAVGEEPYGSPRFVFDPPALEGMIDYLKGSSGVIEPFQLQLLCQHAESIASKKRGTATDGVVTLTANDFAGSQRFAAVLGNFYRNTLAKIPSSRQRKRAAALCEEGLLAESGHRLMLEEGQILGDYHVEAATLATLCGERLVNRERRLDSVFYEISHDRLAESIFEARGAKLPRKLRRVLLAAGAAAVAIVVALAFYSHNIRKERDRADDLIGFLLGQQFLGEIRETGRSGLLTALQARVDASGGAAKRKRLNEGLARRNAGDIAYLNGHLDESIRNYRGALEALGADTDDLDASREIVQTHRQIADVLSDQGHHKEALDHVQAAIGRWHRIIDRSGAPAETYDCVAFADTLLTAANEKLTMGDGNVAPEIDQAFGLASNLLFGGSGPCAKRLTKISSMPDAGIVGVLSRIAFTRAGAYEFTDDSAGAAALAVQASRLAPQSVPMREQVLYALIERGRARLADHPAETLDDYRELQERAEELLRWDPRNRSWQNNRAAVPLLISEAIVECQKQRAPCKGAPTLADAEGATLEALTQLRALAEIDPSSLLSHENVMWALEDHASVLAAQGRHEESLAQLREAQRLYLERPPDPSNVVSTTAYAALLREIANRFLVTNRLPAASASLKESIEILQKLLKDHPGRAPILFELWQGRLAEADLLRKSGRADAAASATADAERIRKQYDAIGRWGTERDRLQAEDKAHYDKGKQLIEKDPAKALRELLASEAAARDYIHFRPGESGGYESLSMTYSQIAKAQHALQKPDAELAALDAAMEASQLAVWLAWAAPPAESKRLNKLLFSARLGLGRYLFDNRREEEAMTMVQEDILVAQRLVEGPTPDANSFELLASSQCKLGQLRHSLKMEGWEEPIRNGFLLWEKAIAIDPKAVDFVNLGNWHAYLADQLEQSRRPEDARDERKRAADAYRRELRSNPNDQEAKDALRELEQRRTVTPPRSAPAT